MNLLIKNGRVIDPSLGLDCIMDIAVEENHFSRPSGNLNYKHVIDATGCIVTPGLIDFHLHLFEGGTDVGLSGDISLFPCGVTSAVDAGSAGYSNYEAFSRQIVNQSRVTVRAFLNVCPAGLVTSAYHEKVRREFINMSRIRAVWEKHRNELLGLKIRFTREIVGDTGLDTLRATVDAAEQLGCPVVVHTTNPPVPAPEIVSLLRPGDIYCHMFQGRGNTILDESGTVYGAVRQAREKGVVFDAASGKNHYCNRVASAAISQGFFPDVISTDLTANTVYQYPVYSLPYMMSKHMNLGMKLQDVIRASVTTPARLMGVDKERGTLAEGALADLSIFKLADKKTVFYDFEDKGMEGNCLLIPQMTVKEGLIVYRQVDFL